MKGEKNRLKKMIESDRLLITTEMSSLITYDLKKLLDNYFNVEGEVALIVNAEKDCYSLSVKAKASGIKQFGIIKY